MLYKYKSSLRRNKTMEDLLNGTPATGVETAPAVGTNNERKEKIQRMKEVLKENIASDPTFLSRMHTLSGAVRLSTPWASATPAISLSTRARAPRTIVPWL